MTEDENRLFMALTRDNWPRSDIVEVVNRYRRSAPAGFRDECAMRFMAACLTRPECRIGGTNFADVAQHAYRAADALIKARST